MNNLEAEVNEVHYTPKYGVYCKVFSSTAYLELHLVALCIFNDMSKTLHHASIPILPLLSSLAL